MFSWFQPTTKTNANSVNRTTCLPPIPWSKLKLTCRANKFVFLPKLCVKPICPKNVWYFLVWYFFIVVLSKLIQFWRFRSPFALLMFTNYYHKKKLANKHSSKTRSAFQYMAGLRRALLVHKPVWYSFCKIQTLGNVDAIFVSPSLDQIFAGDAQSWPPMFCNMEDKAEKTNA